LQEPWRPGGVREHCIVVKMEAPTKAISECGQSCQGKRKISAQASW
jgi:hypothetical protein